MEKYSFLLKSREVKRSVLPPVEIETSNRYDLSLSTEHFPHNVRNLRVFIPKLVNRV